MSAPETTPALERRAFVPGFVLCALSGVLLILAQSGDVVRGLRPDGSPLTLRFESDLLVLGIIMIVAFGGLAVARGAEWRTAGLVLAVIAAGLPVLQVIAARTDEGLRDNTTVTLLGGGKLALAAAALCAVGLALAAVWPAWQAPPTRVSPAVAVLLSALGVLLAPLAGLGIGLGMRGLGYPEHRRRVQSLGAVLVGVVALVGWAVTLAIGAVTFNR